MIPIFATNEFVGTLDLLTNRVFFWYEIKREDYNLDKKPETDPDFQIQNVIIDYSKVMMYASAEIQKLGRTVIFKKYFINIEKVFGKIYINIYLCLL